MTAAEHKLARELKEKVSKKIPGLQTQQPAIVLRNWMDRPNSCVLTLKIFLTAHCEIVGLELRAEPGCATQAAVAALRLGELTAKECRET